MSTLFIYFGLLDAPIGAVVVFWRLVWKKTNKEKRSKKENKKRKFRCFVSFIQTHENNVGLPVMGYGILEKNIKNTFWQQHAYGACECSPSQPTYK